ncbi:hypothetical protein WN55_10394 [Dufourea novaeangliae]|uniref:Uncharacterized protein n=1 Tax=Dufourea novaeangliae TaxID=178035 RepID=A0A154P3S3_DUFNO|nr:hypothetical protein WN55_10394 [Dufourea novaeangliae]
MLLILNLIGFDIKRQGFQYLLSFIVGKNRTLSDQFREDTGETNWLIIEPIRFYIT